MTLGEGEARQVGGAAVGEADTREVGDVLPIGEDATPLGRRLDRLRRRPRPHPFREGEPNGRVGVEHGVLAEGQRPIAAFEHVALVDHRLTGPRLDALGQACAHDVAVEHRVDPAVPQRRQTPDAVGGGSVDALLRRHDVVGSERGAEEIAAEHMEDRVNFRRKFTRCPWRGVHRHHAAARADVESDVGEVAAGLGDAERHLV